MFKQLAYRSKSSALTGRPARSGFKQLSASALAVAMGFFMASSTQAQVSEPETFVDVPVPRLTQWNDVNARTVIDEEGKSRAIIRHSDRSAPVSGRTYIYPDQATKDADTGGTGVGSVAFIA